MYNPKYNKPCTEDSVVKQWVFPWFMWGLKVAMFLSCQWWNIWWPFRSVQRWGFRAVFFATNKSPQRTLERGWKLLQVRLKIHGSLTENRNGKNTKRGNQSFLFSTTNVTEMATSPPKMETTISSSKIHQSYLHSNWQLQTQGYNGITYNCKRRVMLWYVMNVPSSAALKVIPVTSWWNIHIQCLMLLAISWRLVPIGDMRFQ